MSPWGALAGGLVGTVLLTTVLPLVHPGLGTDATSAERGALLEPPGFLMRNYGERTLVVSTTAHVLYGTIVGWFAVLA